MIAIIGAGLSGLSAAKALNDNNTDFILFEASDRLGGRVKSDLVDGFVLDHGFQVLLSSYPQVKEHLDLFKMSVRSFPPGCEIVTAPGKSFKVSDPFRKPSELFKTLLAPIGSFSDKLKILSLPSKSPTKEMSSIDFLKSLNFSDKIIDSFFRPFFSGVLLEKDLKSDANYFHFLYDRFSKGVASLPKSGMQELSKQLSGPFTDKIQFNKKVSSIVESNGKVNVEFDDGELRSFEKVILATEAPITSKLLPSLQIEIDKRSVTTIYFTSDKPVYEDEYLILNNIENQKVNHVAVLTNIQPSYAPEGKHLISVNIIGNEEVEIGQIIGELDAWKFFKTSPKEWKHLKTYKINYAQPNTFYQGALERPFENILLAGDFTETPSIEGSLLSGQKAAKEVLASG